MCSPLIIIEILFPSIQITNVAIFHASTIQSDLQNKLKPMIEEAVASLLKDDGATANAYCSGMAIADLGCSSGPNTLVLVSMAIDAVRRHCSELQQEPPELCIHLNDLPSNDFNSVIRSLATYIKTQESSSPPVLASIVPGSFHGRLFNKRSLHLVCSTASFHWLSKVSMRPTGSSSLCYITFSTPSIPKL
jgi:jasmonate O-methyltransferase